MLRGIGTDLTQEAFLDHYADCTAPTRQHELDHVTQIRNISAVKDLAHPVGIDHADQLSCVRILTVLFVFFAIVRLVVIVNGADHMLHLQGTVC